MLRQITKGQTGAVLSRVALKATFQRGQLGAEGKPETSAAPGASFIVLVLTHQPTQGYNFLGVRTTQDFSLSVPMEAPCGQCWLKGRDAL